ncbi:hypothetical protein [Peribacillus glennii]|uniref:Uncharacterized protein n=1 Tax=Peribacillus glennii TaxID=2303991 RepID=A0A372LFE3_9BACI|nr:hypothetical protein [Peribacillus glennii]RFU65025.1 hypothetical protein D0466_03685 [Peribacillus glennii]
MSRKLYVFIVTSLLIFILAACNKNELNGNSSAEHWNSLDRNQKHIQVATELEELRSSGFTIIVEEYYFIDQLDAYYNDNPSGNLSIHKAIRKIGNSTGTIQVSN